MKKIIVFLSMLLFAVPCFAQPGAGGIKYKTVESGSGTGKKLWVTSMPYAWDIGEGNIADHYGLSKFGHTSDADNDEAVWDGGTAYTYLDDDTFELMYISSSNNADTGLEYTVYGLDCEYNEAIATVDSAGFTSTVVNSGCSGADANKWWRIYRVKCTEAVTNANDRCAAGTIYISTDDDAGADGVPDVAAGIKAEVLPEFNQTEMAMWTVPVGKSFYLTSFYAGVIDNQDIHVGLYIREFGEPQQNKKIILINANTDVFHWDVPLSVPEKSDIVVIAIEATNANISAGFDGWYE